MARVEKRFLVAASLVVLALALSLTDSAVAHPREEGDTYGPHTCRTNCAYWGYTEGEWHDHRDPPPAPARAADPDNPFYGNTDQPDDQSSVWNTILTGFLAVVLFGPFVLALLFGTEKS